MPDRTPNPAAADRNLLFGILALQMDFVGRDSLIAAMHAWVLAKHKPLGQVLAEQGALRPDTHALLDQDLFQRLVLGEHPGAHRRQEGVAGHEVHLQGQDAEQQVAVGGRGTRRGFGHGGASSLGSGR